MSRNPSRLGPIALVLLFALGVPLASSALGEPVSDRAVTEQIVAALSSSDATLTRAPLDEAKRALERATGARRSGDARHAEQLEGLAREWAETARDLVRAAGAEGDAGALEVAAADAGRQAERARALLEEAIARRGRAQAEVDQLSTDAGAFPVKPPPPSATGARPKRPKPADGAKPADVKPADGAKPGRTP